MPPLTSLTLPYITATLAARLEVVISRPRPASHPFTLRIEHTHPSASTSSASLRLSTTGPSQWHRSLLRTACVDEAQTEL